MARQEIKTYKYTDDLTGEEFSEDEITTIEFSYGGRDFRIDLGPKNATKLDDLLTPYMDKAERVNRRASSASGSAPKKNHRPGLRQWAEEQGLVEKGGRGRLPNSVLEAWDAAH